MTRCTRMYVRSPSPLEPRPHPFPQTPASVRRLTDGWTPGGGFLFGPACHHTAMFRFRRSPLPPRAGASAAVAMLSGEAALQLLLANHFAYTTPPHVTRLLTPPPCPLRVPVLTRPLPPPPPSHSSAPPQRAAANEILMQLQTNEQSWTRVDAILENSANQNAKFFALQILEDTIKYRWLTLPGGEDGPREGVKNYVVTKIIALSQDEDTVKRERVFLSKMNLILVQVRGGGERGRSQGAG